MLKRAVEVLGQTKEEAWRWVETEDIPDIPFSSNVHPYRTYLR